MLDFTEMQRSTGRASKMRRDQINTEIETLRQLLPLPSPVKARLSYLQVMSLACVYIRTGNFFSSYYAQDEMTKSLDPASTLAPVEITQALPGFLLLVRPSGTILHISENVIDYLGHSMVEVLSGGGDVYDLVGEADHVTLKTHLHASERNAWRPSRHSFVCQMIMSRSLRRGMPFQGTECKSFHIDGRFHYSEWDCKSGGEGVFLALCTPADTSIDIGYDQDMIRSSTAGFTTKHTLDMRIIDTCDRASLLLGYCSEELYGLPWYHIIRPEYIFIAKNFHQRILEMTGIGDIQCSSTLQLVTKENEVLTTQITARLTLEGPGPGLYPTVSCQYRIIREDIGAQYLYQTKSQADQQVADSRNLYHGATAWPYSGVEKGRVEDRSQCTSPNGQVKYNQEQLPCPLASELLGGLPQPRYVSTSMESGRHNGPRGHPSGTIMHIKSEMAEHYPREEPCQYHDGQPGLDALCIPSSPPHAKDKLRIKKYRNSREHPYPSEVRGQAIENGNQYGNYLERVHGTLDLTCVFGRQDTYRAHGTICLLSSRCSLTELRQRPGGGAVITNNATETDNCRPSCERVKHPETDVFDNIRSPQSSHHSGHWSYDEPKVSPAFDSSSQYAESMDLHWLRVGLDNNSMTPSSIWSSKGFSSNHTLQRQCNRSQGDVSPAEFPTGRRNERYQSRLGSLGMRSVEESVTAALKCLSNDQIKLLDQATLELSKTFPR